MKRLKKLNELFFDRSKLDNSVKFYLLNTDTNSNFAFDVVREDINNLEKILKRNNVKYEIDDGENELPF